MLPAGSDPNNYSPPDDSPDARAAVLTGRVVDLAESAKALSDEAWSLTTAYGDTGDKALRAAIKLRRITRATRRVLGILNPF